VVSTCVFESASSGGKPLRGTGPLKRTAVATKRISKSMEGDLRGHDPLDADRMRRPVSWQESAARGQIAGAVKE
jgi:hypothetical protein